MLFPPIRMFWSSWFSQCPSQGSYLGGPSRLTPAPRQLDSSVCVPPCLVYPLHSIGSSVAVSPLPDWPPGVPGLTFLCVSRAQPEAQKPPHYALRLLNLDSGSLYPQTSRAWAGPSSEVWDARQLKRAGSRIHTGLGGGRCEGGGRKAQEELTYL